MADINLTHQGDDIWNLSISQDQLFREYFVSCPLLIG